VALLDDARTKQTPALLRSRDALNSMDGVKETLSAAVTTGDEESLIKAEALAVKTSDNLQFIIQLDSNMAVDVKPILKAFELYFKIAYDVSKSMVDNSADFSKLQSALQEMNASYDKASANLKEFSDQREVSF
jgi:methyl-accepting chemotaxis protein